MKRRSTILLCLFLAGLLAGLAAGCSDSGEDSPFDGDWISGTAPRLSFEGSSWSDGEGDSGEYSFSGEYPVFSIVFTSDGATVERRAEFVDERTFELCSIGADGSLFDCHDYVLDRPTLH